MTYLRIILPALIVVMTACSNSGSDSATNQTNVIVVSTTDQQSANTQEPADEIQADSNASEQMVPTESVDNTLNNEQSADNTGSTSAPDISNISTDTDQTSNETATSNNPESTGSEINNLEESGEFTAQDVENNGEVDNAVDLTRPPAITAENSQICYSAPTDKPSTYCVDRLTRTYSTGGRGPAVAFVLPGNNESNDVVDIYETASGVFLVAVLNRNSDQPLLERSRFRFTEFIDTKPILRELLRTNRRLIVTTEKRMARTLGNIRRLYGSACEVEAGVDVCRPFVATIDMLEGRTIAYREFLTTQSVADVLSSIQYGDIRTEAAYSFDMNLGDGLISYDTMNLAKRDNRTAPLLHAAMQHATLDADMYWLGNLLSGRLLRQLGDELSQPGVVTASQSNPVEFSAVKASGPVDQNVFADIDGIAQFSSTSYEFNAVVPFDFIADSDWLSLTASYREQTVDSVDPVFDVSADRAALSSLSAAPSIAPTTRTFDWSIDDASIMSNDQFFDITNSRAFNRTEFAVDENGVSVPTRTVDFNLAVSGQEINSLWTVVTTGPISEVVESDQWVSTADSSQNFVVSDVLGHTITYQQLNPESYFLTIVIDGETTYRIEPKQFSPLLRGIHRPVVEEAL